jgi:biopolymer transport protein ExbD
MFENYGLVEHEAQRPEINLAPFVDTIMILLIFFVVTANLYVVTGVDVSKPKAQSARSVGLKAIMIGITREGTIHIFGRQVTLDRLQNVIEQETAKTPDCQVLIIADQESAVGKAVQVMDKCLLAGAAKVSIAAEKE